MPRDRLRPRVHRATIAVALPVLLLVLASPSQAQTPVAPIHATSYIVENAVTGDVLASRDPDRPLPVASLQKMLTALVVVEHTHPDDLVLISKAASHANADHVIWPDGKTFTVNQLLYGMLVESSNGAAMALAEHVAGSQAAFAMLMNEKAAELGATHSHFVNADGLDAAGQQSSARDLAFFAQAVLADPMLAAIVRTRQHEIPWPDGTITTLHSIDRFLVHYPGAIGVKTGFTHIAGNCLAAAAHRNGRTLIAVLIRSTSVTEDASTLMDQWFARLGPGPSDPPAVEGSAPVYVQPIRKEDPIAAVAPRTAVAKPSPWEGRLPSKPGLAIVFTAGGIVAVKRARRRNSRRI
jgi:serine-type D-Ala-D-Ala carboxypeptidase (penicillin-binding protein 5/6)